MNTIMNQRPADAADAADPADAVDAADLGNDVKERRSFDCTTAFRIGRPHTFMSLLLFEQGAH